MPTTSQGIYYPDATTNVAPLHTVFATMASSVDSILSGDVQVHRVANTTARGALVATLTPTAANPVFVWRADAPTGRELEYTKNGSTWHYVKTSEDVLTPMVQRGRASVPFSGTTGTLALVYPVAFPGTPATVCQVLASTVWQVNTAATGSTGATITVFRASGSGTGTVSVDWIAVY